MPPPKKWTLQVDPEKLRRVTETMTREPPEEKPSLTSTSATSSDSAASEAQPPTPGLPPPTKRKYTKRAKTEDIDAPQLPGRARRLPEDDAEQDKVLRKYRAMVRPLLQGSSRVIKGPWNGVELSALDENEMESGTYAFSALLYEHGAEFDSRVLVALFVGSIAISRAAEYLQKRSAKKPALRSVQEAAERPVEGVRLTPIPEPVAR